MRFTSQVLLSAAIISGLCAPVCAAPEGKITEVQVDEEGTAPSILVDQGSKAGIRVGQTVEVRRGAQTIGYGSVSKVFKGLSVATVGTVVAGKGPLKAGDAVMFLDSGFDADTDATTPPGKPASKPAHPSGKVVNVRDGVVLLDFGRKQGLSSGHVVVLNDASGKEVGRLTVELVGPHSAGGLLSSGDATVGLSAVSQGAPHKDVGIDFVALDFLGVVANLEHPTPHRAACHVGVPVRRVLPGSPAEAAGVHRGDRVISVDGLVVRDIAGVRDRIQARRGDRVRVTLLRGDRITHVDVDFKK